MAATIVRDTFFTALCAAARIFGVGIFGIGAWTACEYWINHMEGRAWFGTATPMSISTAITFIFSGIATMCLSVAVEIARARKNGCA